VSAPLTRAHVVAEVNAAIDALDPANGRYFVIDMYATVIGQSDNQDEVDGMAETYITRELFKRGHKPADQYQRDTMADELHYGDLGGPQ
jgi:hypothetical protein